MATSTKSKLALGVELVTPSLKQFAILADGVPNKLFDAVEGLGDLAPVAAPATGGGLLLDWLRAEMAYQLNKALDAHVLAQLIAAKPAFGETGTGIVTQIRNAVSAHRALGANPSILVASPKLASELDALETTTKDFVFATTATGGASPIFGMNIVELGGGASEHAPILLDPAILGINYYSMATLLIDPFSESKTNQSTVRLEFDALFHIRDVSGAYSIGKVLLA